MSLQKTRLMKDPSGRYKKKEIVGRGAYKEVFAAEDKETNEKVAWNQVKITSLEAEQRKKVFSEIRTLNQISHENIIHIHNYWETEDRSYVIFITELMLSGTLRNYLQRKGKISLKRVKSWSRQILKGLEYLHTRSKPIIHRDIKCDNIFVDGSFRHVKIGDLGLSRTFSTGGGPLSMTGTPEFMAPELYTERYTTKVDVYAFGMCLLEMVTGKYPYSRCRSVAQIYRKVEAQERPEEMDEIAHEATRRYVEWLTDPEAEIRPTATEALNHDYLRIGEEEDDEDYEFQVSTTEEEEEEEEENNNNNNLNNNNNNGNNELRTGTEDINISPESDDDELYCGNDPDDIDMDPDDVYINDDDDINVDDYDYDYDYEYEYECESNPSRQSHLHNDAELRHREQHLIHDFQVVSGNESVLDMLLQLNVGDNTSTNRNNNDDDEDEDEDDDNNDDDGQQSNSHDHQHPSPNDNPPSVREVRFSFVLGEDTATGVAEEMVPALGLPPSDVPVVARCISRAIQSNTWA